MTGFVFKYPGNISELGYSHFPLSEMEYGLCFQRPPDKESGCKLTYLFRLAAITSLQIINITSNFTTILIDFSWFNRIIGIQPHPGLKLHIAILPRMEPGLLDFNHSVIVNSS